MATKKKYKKLYTNYFDGGGEIAAAAASSGAASSAAGGASGGSSSWGQGFMQWAQENPQMADMLMQMVQGQQQGGGSGSQAPRVVDRGVTGQKKVWEGDSTPIVGGAVTAVADFANAINSISDKGTVPVEKVIGLPGKYYSCGGKVHKFGGGGSAGNGGGVSPMAYVGAATTGLDIASRAIKASKGVDTKAYEEQVKDFGNAEVKASSNDELLNAWSNRNYLNHIDKYDITGGNLAGDIIGGINSNIADTGKGALAGFNVGGPVGAIVGGAVGLVGNALGQIFGAINTEKKVKALNKSIDRANMRQDRAFSDAASNLKKKQTANMMYNYAAYGGPIYGRYDTPYMAAGPSNYDIAKDNAYARQMQIQAKNSTSFNPIFNSAGYDFAEGGSIHIAPSKRGTFTAAAKKHGKSVQAFASQVLANPDDYSPAMRKKANFARNAAKWHADGGTLMSDDFTNDVNIIGQGGTHENNPHEGVPMGIAPDGAPNLVEEGEAIYKDYVFSNRLRVPKEVRNKYKLRGPKDMTFAEAFIAAQKESEERPNDPISEDSLENIAMILARTQEAVRDYNNAHKKAKGGHLYGPEEEVIDEPEVDAAIDAFWKQKLGDLDSPAARRKWMELDESNPANRSKRGKSSNSLSWLRFAEPLANLGAVASDLMGLTNTPTEFDYIPAFQAVGFNPIGNYIPVTHFDTRYAANQAAQQAAATRAALMQSSGPSKWANILAADYNAQIALGDLLRQGALQDYQMMLDREQFNRGTNQMNSEMGLKAEMANQEQRLKYAQAALQQAKMNEDNSNIASAAKAANLSALAESTANIGRESDARDWKNMLLKSDVYGTISQKPDDWTEDEWLEYQIRHKMASHKDACGGRMKKRKKGLTY